MSSERTLTEERIGALARGYDTADRDESVELARQLAACQQERDEARRQLDGYMESICGDLADMCHCRLDKDHPGPHLGYWGGEVVQWADTEPVDGWHKTRDILTARAEAAEAALAQLQALRPQIVAQLDNMGPLSLIFDNTTRERCVLFRELLSLLSAGDGDAKTPR